MFVWGSLGAFGDGLRTDEIGRLFSSKKRLESLFTCFRNGLEAETRKHENAKTRNRKITKTQKHDNARKGLEAETKPLEMV